MRYFEREIVVAVGSAFGARVPFGFAWQAVLYSAYVGSVAGGCQL